MKVYSGSEKRGKRYDGKKKKLCLPWRAPMVKWLRRKERREAKELCRAQIL